MNKIIIDGYIVKSETSNSFHFFPANGDKHAMCRFSIRNRRPRAQKDENGHYPYDFYSCKAFGKTAEFLNGLTHGDAVSIDGRLTVEEANERNGKQYPATVVILVENVEYSLNSSNNNKANTAPVFNGVAATAAAPVPNTNVFGTPTVPRQQAAAPKTNSPFSPF